ncbi:hypothetical protein [Nocardia sp. BMG51109]|uniref:hypothetical protein n=1 Tax=Nocardia sp. BMG51109 TaxID=1056816 RepID=UPI00046685A4|nr:hypothetical protein [Nocardia sp. BMG51109]
MKRHSAIAVALCALALGPTACGGDDSGTDAAGLRRNAPPSTATSSAPAPSATTAAAEPSTDGPTTAPSSEYAALGPASRTPCSEFKNLDTEAEKSTMEQVLAENPGSKFEGSPNVALGTAKLVCLAESRAETPVAVAIGIAEE